MQIKYRRELVDLLRSLNLPLIGAEVGVAEANHSADLLRNGMDKLFLVDSWNHIPKIRGDGNNHQQWHEQNFAKARRQVKEFGDRAVILRGFSVDMASHVDDDSLSLVYLDADHSYNGVMTDLNTWFPKLKKGGVMAGHDFMSPEYGVKQAVEEFCKDRYEVHVIPEDKKEDAGFWFQKI
jgi:hypothetical protein